MVQKYCFILELNSLLLYIQLLKVIGLFRGQCHVDLSHETVLFVLVF